MKRRRIGKTDLMLSELGFGCTALGGMYRPTSQAEAGGAVATALARGVNFFDVAPAYGFGLAELRLGGALGKAMAIVSTKTGRLLVPADRGIAPDDIFVEPSGHVAQLDYSAAGMRRSLEQSLARLGRSSVDILLLHDFTTRFDRSVPEPLFRQSVDEALAEMARMRAEGLIRAIGIGVNEVALARRYLREADLDVVMIAGKLTLLDSSAEDELLPECRARNVGILAAAPFSTGVVADESRFNYGSPEVVKGAVQALDEIALRNDVSLKACALQFALRFDEVVSVVAGMQNARQVAENAGAMCSEVPKSIWPELDHVRLRFKNQGRRTLSH